jgi:Cu/Ag efflux pump CusA
LDDIRNLLIDTPSGDQVRLGDVASVTIVPTPNMIQHDTVSRYIDVSLNVRGRDAGSVANDIKQRLQKITFPLEYRAQILGAYEVQQADFSRLLGVGLAAAVAIFLLLQAAFWSWRLASVVFFALPSALLGGVVIALTIGNTVSFASLLGLLAVFGIAVRNSLILIKRYQHLEQREGKPLSPELILQGAQERFTPILITALAVGLVMVPLAVTGNIAGQEIANPLALIILGGLVTSTIFSLFIVPSLYLGFGPKSSQQSAIEGGMAGASLNGDFPNARSITDEPAIPPNKITGALFDGDSASTHEA